MTVSNYRTPAAERAALAAYQQALDAWPVPAEQHALPTRHGDAFAISWGDLDAPPMVLFHGAIANSSTWAGAATELGERYRVHAVDLPGEAGRSDQRRPPYAGSTYADWVRDVFDGLGIESARIGGLSLGGWVALKFASAAPARAERVFLMAPGGIVPARKMFIAHAVLYGVLGRWGAEQMTKFVFSPQTPPPGMGEAFASMARSFKPRRQGIPSLTDAELRNLAMPVLLAGGDRDALLDMRAAEKRLAAHLPDFRSHIIPGAGHVLLDTGDVIAKFLNEA